jgi:hypothetical protein
MKLGCSYFGNRILKHVIEDMRELKDFGCTYVVHTFNENDFTFFRQTIGEIVQATRELGLEVYIDPWGVGKVFGGESFSNFVMQNMDAVQMINDGKPAGCACPNHPKFRAFMREWTDAAVETGADVLFWDEPHFYIPNWMGGRPNTWGCCCEVCQQKFQEQFGFALPSGETTEVRQFKENCIHEFLAELVKYGHEKGMKNALCVLPLRDESHSTANWERMASIPHLDIFGTDPYWIVFEKPLQEFVGNSCRQVREICETHGLESQMWLQGYKIPAGREGELIEALDLMAAEKIRNIAVWGFDACRHISWIRPDNPDLTWAKVKEGYRRLAKSAE